MILQQLQDAVLQAWADVPAPLVDDMDLMEPGWGVAAARTFIGIAPIDVDTDAPGFHAATPLMDLPPRAAAAYLGTYLLSLLRSLMLQESVGIHDDLVTRPHTLTCLCSPVFWQRVIRPHLTAERLQATLAVSHHLADRAAELALTPEQAQALRQAGRTG